MLNIRRITHSSEPTWQQCVTIYRDVFPSDEREPEAILCDGIDSGEYHLWIAEQQGKVVGFYILSLYPDFNYVLFSYLAVAANKQGHGIGRDLCRHAITTGQSSVNAKWLLVEAQARQAIYYGQLGFLMLQYCYLAPSFDSTDSIPMSLMAISSDNLIKHIEINELNAIVSHLFTVGYQLAPSDQRLEQQLSRQQTPIALIAWG